MKIISLKSMAFIIALSSNQIDLESSKKLLLSEYHDYCLKEPPLASIVVPTDTGNFKSDEFIASSEYAPLVVDQGFIEISQNIRDAYGSPLLIRSAYRNPKRNANIGGVEDSVHMSGGAVDLAPAKNDKKKMYLLYSASLEVSPGLVILEKGTIQLLKGNWRPPRSGEVIKYGPSSVTVFDFDNDGMVDSISSLAGKFPSGKALTLNGNDYMIGRRVGEAKVGDVFFIKSRDKFITVSEVFENATHVHADNRKLVEKIANCKPSKVAK